MIGQHSWRVSQSKGSLPLSITARKRPGIEGETTSIHTPRSINCVHKAAPLTMEHRKHRTWFDGWICQCKHFKADVPHKAMPESKHLTINSESLDPQSFTDFSLPGKGALPAVCQLICKQLVCLADKVIQSLQDL